MSIDVMAFTDTYFPSINGVTYTIDSWRHEWNNGRGRMEVVFPDDSRYTASDGEHPVRSVHFPFYEEFQLGLPLLPKGLLPADIVHLHGQFMVGLAGLRYAHRQDLPVIASHHMFGEHYANYLSLTESMEKLIYDTTQKYERMFYDRVEKILAPSKVTKEKLVTDLGISKPIEVLPNGVDTDFFQPTDTAAFLDKYDIPTDKPIVGYTGRQGYEKELFDIIEAVEGLDVTVVMGGDGPANEKLRSKSKTVDTEFRFLGFLDRAELPPLYSALDLFLFPSPVETQGLVALEAICCGTPVVGVRAGALADTIDHENTGYLYEPGEIEVFREQIVRGLSNREELRQTCLDRRSTLSITATIERLAAIYDDVLTEAG